MSFLGDLEEAIAKKQSFEFNLTEKERGYLALRAEGKTKKEASEAVDLSYSKAIKLDEREDSIIYVAAIKQIFMTATGIDSNYILANLQRIYEKAMAGYWVEGKDGGGYQKYEYGPALKALEMMGKHLGMFTEKIEHSHTGEVTLVNQISIEEAKKALQEDTEEHEVIEVKALEESIEHLPESD